MQHWIPMFPNFWRESIYMLLQFIYEATFEYLHYLPVHLFRVFQGPKTNLSLKSTSLPSQLGL